MVVMAAQNWFLNPPAPLLAIELQYFRLPRSEWERMLFRLRQAGANTISTYVMWGWHEPQESLLDFRGDTSPERDLLGFIRLAQEMGFWMLLKPGPFIDAETLGGGIPSWLLKKIPEAHALRHDGQTWRHLDSRQPRLSYLHPAALDYAERWLKAFSQAAIGMQWPSGPVIALQVDNETPGDGLIAGDVGDESFDYHFRGDYNPYYLQTLWPQWLETRYGHLSNLEKAYGLQAESFQQVPFPQTWSEPAGQNEVDSKQIALWMDAARFTDWTYSQVLRRYTGILQGLGWQVPFFQDLLCMPWEASGYLVNMGSLATAVGWLGHNVYPAAVRSPIVDTQGYKMGFEEYVQHAYWRAKIARNYTPAFPGFVPEISAAGDFFFQSLFAGGTEAVSIYVGAQSNPEPSAVGAFPRWATEAPFGMVGEVRRRMWNAKTLLDYLTAAGRYWSLSSFPASVVVGYSHVPELVGGWFFLPDYFKTIPGRAPGSKPAGALEDLLVGSDNAAQSQVIAQKLLRMQIDFDVIDVDFASPDQFDPARLFVLPAARIMSRRTQVRLGEFLRKGGRLVLIGGALPELDETLAHFNELGQAAQETGRVLLMPDLTADWDEEVTKLGYLPRYAWCEATQGVDVTARFGPDQTVFLSVVNRTEQVYEGMVHYIGPDRKQNSLKVRVAGPHVSFIALRGGRLESAVLYGQEGAYIQVDNEWYSIDRGQVVLARHGSMMAISSPEAINVRLFRNGGWGNASIWQMLLDGRVLPQAGQVVGEMLSLTYQAETGSGETLMTLVGMPNEGLPAGLRPLFETGLAFVRLTMLKASEQASILQGRLAAVGNPLVGELDKHLVEVAQWLQQAGDQLRVNSSQPLNLEAYNQRLDSILEAAKQPVNLLVDGLRKVRAEIAAGEWPAGDAWVETELTGILLQLGKIM
jgi:hypothetical protein